MTNLLSSQRLGLGTVQFGTNYGLTNTRGQVSESNVRDILFQAQLSDIKVLDTASLYGNSEIVLGRALPPGHGFNIVSKTPVSSDDEISGDFLGSVERSLDNSLRNLGVDALYGLLVHHGSDLSKAGGVKLAKLLEGFREDGRVKRIGVSVYDGAELEGALDVFHPDIVQLPYNILDQRMVNNGKIQYLKKHGIEIHARSLFLQGALLADPAYLPEYFIPAKAKLEHISRSGKKYAIGNMGMCLLAAFGRSELDVLLVGVTHNNELQEILNLLPKLSELSFDPDEFALDDETILNPALWPAT